MAKKLLLVPLAFIFFQLISGIGFSQQPSDVMVLIENPNFERLHQIPQLKTYFHDVNSVIGEVSRNDLVILKKYGIEYRIIDERGWSGEYYVVSPRPGGNALSSLRVGEMLHAGALQSIIKVTPAQEDELFQAGLQLEKITRVKKPLPPLAAAQLHFVVHEDSAIRQIIDQVSATELLTRVQRLQDFKTRYTHSDSIIHAGQWIYNEYLRLGYTDVKFDTFYLETVAHRNIIATKPGLIYPDSVIMIGGHYDSFSSTPLTAAPGAEDNASGTVAAIEAARILADHHFAATIKFVAWDAEEIGLVGSERYARKAYSNKEKIGFYLNFDMIGFRHPSDPRRDVQLFTDQPSRPYAELTAEMAKTYTSLMPVIPGNSSGSDHRSFQSYGYRSIFGFEGDYDFSNNPHYHQPSDKTQYMDFEYMKEVVQMGVATIVHLAGLADNFEGRPFVKYQSHTFDDDMLGSSYGNGNGYLDAGETIELTIGVKNLGDSLANEVQVSLSSSSPMITIANPMQSYSSIPAQATATNQTPFILKIAADAVSGQKIDLDLRIADNRGNRWTDQFKLQVTMPHLVYRQKQIEEVSGNGDSKIDAGETYHLSVELENSGLRAATSISAILRTSVSGINIVDSLAQFPNISQYHRGANSEDFFTIQVQPDIPPMIVTFEMYLSEGGGFYHSIIPFNLAVGQSRVLVVEDDGRAEFFDLYKDALEMLGLPYDHWNTAVKGPVTLDTLSQFGRVIWYTGNEFGNSLFRQGTAVLEQYLAKGGKLFANGGLFAFSMRDSALMTDYLGAKYISYRTNLHHLQTDGSNSVLGDLNFWLSKSGDNNQSLTGELDAIAPAEPILFYDRNSSEGAGNIQSNGAAAVAMVRNNCRSVLFSFGWEGIADDRIREQVLAQVLNWLDGIISTIENRPGDQAVPKQCALLPNYPNPFNPSTTIGFAVPQASRVTIKIFNLVGEEITTLVDANFAAGWHRVIWDGKNYQRQRVASGVYIYRMTVGNYQLARKMIVIY
ncbi:MAG: M20/M25/M40 family metallo-hydrolase [candidate division KSB1 bacterium]|nr:M20/M25/M40 family metallo-hydrolase [candidate division KSB1 bacterium]